MEIRPPQSESEIRHMWELNHAVFSRELHQHALHNDGLLVDKFHAKNHYMIAIEDGVIYGMMCAHSQPPFSASEKFGAVIDPYITPGTTAEVRLFSIVPSHRKGTLAAQIAAGLFRYLLDRKIETLLISGVSMQRLFYERCGFKTIGDPVQEGDSVFYPMVGALRDIIEKNPTLRRYDPSL